MNLYHAVKSMHASAAAVSIALFLVRGIWMLWAPERLQLRWVRIVPHVVDTLLLASALWLAWQLNTGGPHEWLVAKVVGLVFYVVFGTIALKRGRTPGVRIAAFLAAVVTFGYIVSVAITKSPLGFLAHL